MLEVASQSTGRVDVGPKRDDNEWFRIREYWRFDQGGALHGARLAGDWLAAGEYEPIEIEEYDDCSLRGSSAVLGVELQWRDGRRGWLDRRPGQHIPTFLDERAQVAAERARADAERSDRILVDRRADAERARDENAGGLLRRLERELRGLRGE